MTFTVAVEPLPGGLIARAKICAGHLTQDPAQPNLLDRRTDFRRRFWHVLPRVARYVADHMAARWDAT